MLMQLTSISPTVTRVTARSQASGKIHSLDLPVEIGRIEAWHEGVDRRMVQVAFPELSADQREFLMTGITGEEWDNLFKGDEDAQK